MARKKKKIRAELRKNRQTRVRKRDVTRDYARGGRQAEDAPQSERISGKGALSRKRTVVGIETDDGASGMTVLPEVDQTQCLRGTVLRVGGLRNVVLADEDHRIYQCATRRLLKSLSTDQRHVVTAGDQVWFRPAHGLEGLIERVEPRRTVLCRTSRGRRHVMVANVDQMFVIGSAAEPEVKPHLIDRLLVTAEKSKIRPIVCINKIDLIDPASLQPLVGVYGQLGYQVLLVSAIDGVGVEALRDLVKDQRSVFIGQSGVGKSSLLNAVEPGLGLKVSSVSAENQKGRHTTTSSSLIPLELGGFVVDTPGIRQFELWDVVPEELAGYFREMRPYVSYCRFPDCTHRHEADCAVKDAVAEYRIDARRYDSYCLMFDPEGTRLRQREGTA